MSPSRPLSLLLTGTVHYFSDSSDDVASDVDSEDDACKRDDGHETNPAVLMAAVHIGDEAVSAAMGDAAMHAPVAGAVADEARAGCVADEAAPSTVTTCAPAAPALKTPQLQLKHAACGPAIPPSSHAPSARMCSSIVMKAGPFLFIL